MCLASCGAAAAGDVAAGAGWSLSDDGVLTVGADYEWAEQVGSGCQEGWKVHLTAIKGVVMADGVSSIADYAFADCGNLLSVSLPASLEVIGGSAFYNCAALAGFAIPAGVTDIGDHAFQGCSLLKDVKLPQGLKKIADRLFSGCSSLASVGIPAGVTAIGESAFEECKSLKEVSLPAGLTTIGFYAFFQCDSLESVAIPQSVYSIGANAFYSCTALKSVTLPDGLATIDRATFSHCSALQAVSLPAGVTTISDEAFISCRALESVTIPASVTAIGEEAFYDCPRLKSVVSGAAEPPSLERHAFSEAVGLLLVPAEAAEAYKASDWASYFTDITSVKAEGKGWMLTDLGNLTVGPDYEWKGEAADGCAEDWESYATGVRSVDIEDGVTKVAPGSFSGFGSLSRLRLAASVSVIGDGAFGGCAGLKSVTSLSPTPPLLGDEVFAAMIDSLTVPYGAEEAYGESEWLKYFKSFGSSVVSGEGWSLSVDGVLSVGQAYEWKTEPGGSVPSEDWNMLTGQVRGVVIDEGVEKVSDMAFAYCEGLTSVRLAGSVTSIGSMAFAGCGSLSSVGLPEGLTTLGIGAFGMCASLESVVVPDGVAAIEDLAFFSCGNLRNADIPASVTSVGYQAFALCDGLSSFTCRATTPPALGADAFSEELDCQLYVPAEAVEAYKASGWAQFFADILALPTPPATAVADVAETDVAAVRVTDGVVTLGGSPATEVYSLHGLRMPAGRPLGRGVYVVATPRGAVKVAVR